MLKKVGFRWTVTEKPWALYSRERFTELLYYIIQLNNTPNLYVPEALTLHNKSFSNQNKGHLGSNAT